MTLANYTVPRRTQRVERFETVVIGAGQAGLAVGHHLAARDVDFAILSDAGRRQLAQTLGFAEALHSSEIQRTSGNAVPRAARSSRGQG